MQAGKLRQRIKIYHKTVTRSATGALKAGKWEHMLTLWAQFSPLSAKDAIAAKAAGTDISARCQIRHRTDIEHTMRIEHAGRMYEIVGEPMADNETGREYLTLMLKGVTSDENQR